jgi:hypothetical protein
MYKQLSKQAYYTAFAFLIVGIILRIMGNIQEAQYFIFLGLYFDLKAHLYRIQDNA